MKNSLDTYFKRKIPSKPLILNSVVVERPFTVQEV